MPYPNHEALTHPPGAVHGTSKEANKETAKDSNASVGDRVQSAGNTVSDKAKEMGRDTSAEANKQSATHK